MFCRIHNFIKRHIQKKFFSQDSRRGQVGLVLILIIAIGLVFYAVTLNLGGVSQIKTLTVIAANTTAAFLGSTVASHGEAQLQQLLGGDTERCEWSPAFATFLKILVIVAIVAISVATGGFGFGAAAVTLTVIGGAISIAMATTSFVLWLTVIDPAITELINSMVTSSMSQVDSTVENGVQMGLQGVVTDQVMIPDFVDIDHDGRFHKEYFDRPDAAFGLKPLPESGRGFTEDTAPRFAYYLYQRVRKANIAKNEGISDFLEGLSLLVKGNPTAELETDLWKHWALWDPVKNPVGSDSRETDAQGNSILVTNVMNLGIDYCQRNPAHVCCQESGPSFPAECDPCCQPMFDPRNPQSGRRGPRPDFCRNRNLRGNNSCANRSPYFISDANADNDYPLVYDPFFDNPVNNDPTRHDPDDPNHYFLSFKEFLGRDDEHHLFKVNPDRPNYRNSIPAARQLPEVLPPGPGGGDIEEIRLADATGFYKDPFYNPRFGDDRQEGIFPFLYKTWSWGVDLAQTDFSDPRDFDTWCDDRGPVFGSLAFDNIDASSSGEQTGLNLPRNPGNFNGGWCVDSSNVLRNGNNLENPLLLDTVDRLDPILYGPYNQCLYPKDYVRENAGVDRFSGWLPGSDRFCAGFYPFPVDENRDGRIGAGENRVRVWPYWQGCPKQGEYRHCQRAADPSSPNSPMINVDCQCGDPGTTDPDWFNNPDEDAPLAWPDDQLDEIVYELNVFLQKAASVLSMGNSSFLINNPEQWIWEILDWVEPSCPGGLGDDERIDPEDEPEDDICLSSYSNREREGRLHTWQRRLSQIEDAVWDWIWGNIYVSPSCTVEGSPEAVWCVPPLQNNNNHYGVPECGCVNPEEAGKFGIIRNGRRSPRLEDVINCLEWNADDENRYEPRPGEVYTTGGSGVGGGNADKFRKCSQLNFCKAGACSHLPRSLIPGFCEAYQNMDFPDDGSIDGTNEIAAIVDFEDCMRTAGAGDAARCQAECNYRGRYAGAPYNIPNFNNNDCNAIAAGQNNAYYNAVVAAFGRAIGHCDDIQAANNVFRRDFLIPSADEAENQIEKMRVRYKFLEERLKEARKIANHPDEYRNADGSRACPNAADPNDPRCKTGELTEAVARLTAFLDNGTSWNSAQPQNPYFEGPDEDPPPAQDSPVEKLIEALQDQGPPLPSVAIYVWQDPPLKEARSDGSREGYWHAAKVEVRVPMRCNKRCKVDGTYGELDWPGIKTSTEGFLDTERCYRLRNREGLVKARVIRYDENREPASMKWPNRRPIWKIMANHPFVGGEAHPENAWVECRDLVDPRLEGAPMWERAFMINTVPLVDDLRSPLSLCWRAVHNLMLKYGIESESCAQYFLGGATYAPGQVAGQCTLCGRRDQNGTCVDCRRYAQPIFGQVGFKVRFVPCDDGFLRGQN